MIPLIDLKSQYAPLHDTLKDRIADVIGSGQFILGPNVEAFERETARYLGRSHSVGVASGTDALILVLDAMGIGLGDEVICPAFTFFATALAIARVGATPVFCDIDADTLNLDGDAVSTAVTERTRAIIAVDLCGRRASYDGFPVGIPVIEDAAQAFGADGVPTDAVASTFSFYPSKNLGGLGDGGLVVTDDEDIASDVRMLRFYGSRDKEVFNRAGYNSRLDEIQAAALRVFLPHIDGWNEARRVAAARYAQLGLGAVCELPRPEPGHIYHLFLVRTPRRDVVLESLRRAGVGCAAYFSTPLHLQPVFASLGYRAGSMPETERVARDNIGLPMWAGIDEGTQERVVELVRDALSGD